MSVSEETCGLFVHCFTCHVSEGGGGETRHVFCHVLCLHNSFLLLITDQQQQQQQSGLISDLVVSMCCGLETTGKVTSSVLLRSGSRASGGGASDTFYQSLSRSLTVRTGKQVFVGGCLSDVDSVAIGHSKDNCKTVRATLEQRIVEEFTRNPTVFGSQQ